MSPMLSPTPPIPRFQLPAWWFVLDIAGALMLAVGLVGWFSPGGQLASWLPARLSLTLLVFGAVLLLAAVFLLVRMLLQHAHNPKRQPHWSSHV